MTECVQELKDRIEALTAKVKLMDDLDVINGEKIEALEAKLAKAVEAEMTDDLRTQKLKWFVETGYVDGGGIGYWDGTKESIEVESQSAAYALRDEWLDEGKLIKTHWGELRPTFSYGTFRIRSIWVDVPNPLTDRIKALEAKLAEAEKGIAAHKGKAEVPEARTYWSDYEEYCVIAEIENSEAVTLGEKT